ncbi:hypothetical protein E2C01_035123 [Portunus trituberculatus]|uniref:Uncharacterized protein n=1 Tax=Portunus trituberculatus TaxID=210409 RepID=A0A5B7F8A7_PORTR|nr:hypothetical protein [Portunus trituberculatus]
MFSWVGVHVFCIIRIEGTRLRTKLIISAFENLLDSLPTQEDETLKNTGIAGTKADTISGFTALILDHVTDQLGP